MNENYHTLENPIGAVWLLQHCKISLVQPLYVLSSLGNRRYTHHYNNYRHEIYQRKQAPNPNIISHFQFYLRHEIIHFEFLARLFDTVSPQIWIDWLKQEPTGQYARKAGFFYEWFTQKTLNIDTIDIGGNYVDALDSSQIVVANQAKKNKRWRINDNIAGTTDFCPLIVKTEHLLTSSQLPIRQWLTDLNVSFGEHILTKASVWLTLRESKASFTIEGEGNQTSRIERFAQVLANQAGMGDLPLNATALANLQQKILGNTPTPYQYGIRQSPVFIGQTFGRNYEQIVHYIAPSFNTLPKKLDGLSQFIHQTQGQSAVLRCAVVAFSFVYIHPLADGNGRVHRFLINDMLRRDAVLTYPMILPISGLINDERKQYDEILDKISKPLMNSLLGEYSFNKEHTAYQDGISSNLLFDNDKKAEPVWRFLDLTAHVIYLGDLLQKVIQQDMRDEAIYLKRHDKIRTKIQEIIDIPNDYLNRLIRSIEQNGKTRTNKLLKEMPFLADDKLWQIIVDIVKGV